MSEKFQAFKAGDWHHMRQSSAQHKEEQPSFEKRYPVFEQYLRREDFSAIFQKCEASCIEFDRVVRSASKQDADDAQKILNAYGRAMQLAVELLEIKSNLRRG